MNCFTDFLFLMAQKVKCVRDKFHSSNLLRFEIWGTELFDAGTYLKIRGRKVEQVVAPIGTGTALQEGSPWFDTRQGPLEIFK
jgi:hypothetical protein